MKKLSYIIATAFLALGMAACDVIEEPYKKDNGGGNPGGEPGAGVVMKNVLLEDYTGVRCVNCPAAGQVALNLQEQYEHRVVVLGVHAGPLASVPPTGIYPDFRTDEGTTWFTHFGFDSNPVGTVNRKLNGGVYAYQSTEWTDAVASALQEEAQVEMTPEVTFDNNTRKLDVNVKSKFLAELSGTYSLTVCIMEDSIVGRQEGMGADYTHRHVFRGTINGTWGEDINTTTIAPQDEIVKSYSTTLDADYNADQCYIIAYVANSETKEILQVIEKKIK